MLPVAGPLPQANPQVSHLCPVLQPHNVADNGGGTMSAVTLPSGTVSTLVTGVKAAQGLAMRADGTFLVVDEKSGDIRVAMGC